MSAAEKNQPPTLASLVLKHGVRCTATYGGTVPEDWGSPGAHPYRVTLRMGRRQMTVPFYMGAAHTKEPTAVDVLGCLLMDASAEDESFESWAENFGLNTDSRKAERTYKACLVNAKKVRRLLGDHFETFRHSEMP